jgi:WXG100 protein secretion system (Wss), protein YukD
VTADVHCRITVVGGHRQVDMAVPAAAPITAYIDTVAGLCEAVSNDTLPSAWSLGPVTGGPFAPERSLAELGIVDGQVLYLRDVIADEYADPVVRDVGERVAEVVDRGLLGRWDAAARTMTVMAFGLCWLFTALVVLALLHLASGTALADIAVTAGLVLPALAWVAAERRWPAPSRLREAFALSAVPMLVFAAWMMIAVHWHAHSRALVTIVSETRATPAGLMLASMAGAALVGAFLAYVASPGVTTCAVLFAAVVATVLCGGLALARANGIESASFVAVVAFGLLTAAPITASRIVPFAYRRAMAPDEEQDDSDHDAVTDAVHAATALLVLWGGALAAVLAVALVAMAASRSGYAVAAAGCLGLALLLRAGAARLVTEVVPVSLAGATGVFTLLAVGPGHLGWPAWTGKAAIGLIAAAALTYGLRRLFRPGLARASRPRWLTECSSLLGGISVPLALATSGVLGVFVDLGHQI